MRFLRRSFGFTLVELLTVIGVIALLVAILLPTLAKARRHAETVQCQSNLKQVGYELLMYAQRSRGWLFPPGLNSSLPPDQRWPVHVFKPPVWNPPVMICPSDIDPLEEHSYMLNDHLWDRKIKLGSGNLAGRSSSEIVVMGEKQSDEPDYYMSVGNFPRAVEPYRHGINVGSNYLFLDWHVQSQKPTDAEAGFDPWDVATPL